MNPKAVFNLCYRYIRTQNHDLAVGNLLYRNNRQMYRAASNCYVNEATDFSGWLNRDRKYRFYALKSALLMGER